MHCTEIILSGGSSKRIPPSHPRKQFLYYNGEPLIVQAVQNTPKTCEHIIITVKNNTQLQETKEVLNKSKINTQNVKIITDTTPYEEDFGPVNGFISGLNQVTTPTVLFKPVDTPNLIPSHYKALIEMLKKYDTTSFIDRSGYISTLNVAIKNPKERLAKMKAIIEKKLERGFKIRASDIFLTGKNIALLRIIDQAVQVLKNINTLTDLETPPVSLKKINIFNDNPLIITNSPDFLAFLEKIERHELKENQFDDFLRPWAGTHIYGQLLKDITNYLKHAEK